VGLISSAIADLGYVKEAALIEPLEIRNEKMEQKWSLVFCNKDKSFCQKSSILHFGKIKILVDGDFFVYGMDQNEKLFELKLVKNTKVYEDKEVLFI
jgi:hypothetical protein